MNSLLKRQIRKYLSENLSTDKDLELLLDAVNRSYNNYEEQFSMQQRAMAISSDELFEANQKLKKEAVAQQEVINKLKRVIDTLKFYNLPESKTINTIELDGLKLVEYIDNQTKEIVEINKQREKLLNELAHQNQELNDYAHMVSHDLKSPLRNIDSLTAWLKEDYKDKLDESGQEQLNLIRSNVEKMDILISGILEYSTIGKNQIDIYEVNLDNLIDNILRTIQIPDHITFSKATLPSIQGDKYRLQQLFQNLISNAIKYNDKEEGFVKLDFEDQKEYWLFKIEDNGIGIEEVYFDKIFETFKKLENNPDSSGIGLSIVKKIISLYEGKIWVESIKGKGSIFYFTLKKHRDGTA